MLLGIAHFRRPPNLSEPLPLFAITVNNAKAIAEFSAVNKEAEVILPLGTHVKVDNYVYHSGIMTVNLTGGRLLHTLCVFPTDADADGVAELAHDGRAAKVACMCHAVGPAGARMRP